MIDSIDDVLRVREVRRALEARDRRARRRARDARARSRRCAGPCAAIDRSAAEARDGVDEDLAFHRLLAEAAGNPHFGRLLGSSSSTREEAMRVTRRNDATRADFVEAVRLEHAAIVDAIAAGDPALARRRAIQHMRGGDRRMRSRRADRRTRKRSTRR